MTVSHFFNRFVDEDGIIGPTEMEDFLTECKIDPESKECLVFAYICGADTMGVLTLKQFQTGCEKLKLKKGVAKILLTKLEEKTKKIINKKQEFRQLFAFAFQYLLEPESELQKSVETESLSIMLGLLCPNIHQVNSLKQFMENGSYKALNKDQWMSILDFIDDYSDDLSDYDDTAAWPVFLDDYVEWFKSQ